MNKKIKQLLLETEFCTESEITDRDIKVAEHLAKQTVTIVQSMLNNGSAAVSAEKLRHLFGLEMHNIEQWRKDLAQAVMDGKVIEMKHRERGEWLTVQVRNVDAFFDPCLNYDKDFIRVKPE